MQARENTSSDSRADASDYGAVNLEQLPAYEEAGRTVPVNEWHTEEHAGDPSAPPGGIHPGQTFTANSQDERSSEAAPNVAPPSEPPPGYEEAQRDHVAEALERDMRIHGSR